MSRNIRIIKSIYRDFKYRRYLAIFLGIAAFVVVAQPFLIGNIYSDAKAIELLQGLKSSSLYFGSAIATTSATVLALMLTLLSMTNKSDTSFDKSTYRGITVIGFISTATFVGAILLLLCLSLPVGEFENIPDGWFKALYYTISTLNGMLSGLMIVGILILFETVSVLIQKLSP